MTAYELGYDAAVNGPNKINCHFSIFRSEAIAREWERGNRDGKAKKANSVPDESD